jgi:hypothetical protein
MRALPPLFLGFYKGQRLHRLESPQSKPNRKDRENRLTRSSTSDDAKEVL